MTVSTRTGSCSQGAGEPSLARQAMVCFRAVAVMTRGKVYAAKLGANFLAASRRGNWVSTPRKITLATTSMRTRKPTLLGVTDCT